MNNQGEEKSMKYFIVLAVAMLSLLGSGCAGDKSKELYETAQFEEKQNNREHAEKLYAEIVAKYPNSAVANQARERLVALRAKP
jgi:outer membrane protein assembly factor BamD (BamD/ComL family)